MNETRSVETNAVDIETAIDLGLKELGVSRESVIVEILEEPSRGLLGIGARQARVRLTTAAPSRPMPVPEVAAPKEMRPTPLHADEAEYEEIDSQAILATMTPADEAELDDDARVGLATLQELLAKMQITAQVTVYRAQMTEGEQAPWVLQIRGRDLGVLIGRRGETLTALQYITRLIASRELQRRINIVLDVEGYKSRREEMLRRLAKRMADQAVQTGRTVVLEPMPPYERRIVHLALRDHPEVTTESIGEGDHRKVTIVPRRH
ncbi:MAG TPA: RNA-binding cell elongation regulator Jag/EloR [Aggregatilineaceae bacterium]|nr:RNA-binding cell elongation regulator Jag/EloR [Aggregatilineaceae bacterium]